MEGHWSSGRRLSVKVMFESGESRKRKSLKKSVVSLGQNWPHVFLSEE